MELDGGLNGLCDVTTSSLVSNMVEFDFIVRVRFVALLVFKDNGTNELLDDTLSVILPFKSISSTLK